ncbi:hypothetical protein JVT61DRAFT_4704 [Boletus reticuloceps]|uniref:DUF6533 domain-containing protein n=1 Tax=Boletus reticuloceps TaxID=495285 RepID=A0A8I3A6Z3_9AGAM|nr:hypothetical protein JVT61DRAFT_4704 [Boletus reticuloceps]
MCLHYQKVAGISILVWDIILTFQGESEYIWRMRRCVFKWFYFYFRYFLLAVHIFHLAISPALSSGQTPHSLCIIWYRYIILIAQLSFSMVHIILAIRVHALFNRNRKICVFLGSLILLESGFAVIHVVKCLPIEYLESCFLIKPHRDLADAHAVLIMTIQSILMGMFTFKRVVGVRLGWGRTPLMSFLMNEAASNYVVVFLLCGTGLAFVVFDDQRAIITFYWSTPLFSAVGCRLILNMERFARRYPPDEEIMLTSHITL